LLCCQLLYSDAREALDPSELNAVDSRRSFQLKVVMAADAQTRKFVVRGRVQGVGFRWFVEREAKTLGISGWVRNNSDGSVEVLATGTRDQLSGLRSRLQQGPRAARVDNVQELEAKPVSGLNTFRIEGAW
jgi:acylphosphatase